MFYLIAATAAVILVCVLSAWAFPSVSTEEPDAAAGDGKPARRPAAQPQSLEGVLVAQLVVGQITPGQYRRAVEGLAARDDKRHPLSVPPDIGPSNA